VQWPAFFLPESGIDMTDNKTLAVAQIVSAIISKDSSLTGLQHQNGAQWRFTQGVDVLFDGERREVLLVDKSDGRECLSLKELVGYVADALDEIA
jgi:hypothetical protein